MQTGDATAEKDSGPSRAEKSAMAAWRRAWRKERRARVLEMRLVGGQSVTDIARALGTVNATVWSDIEHARRLLARAASGPGRGHGNKENQKGRGKTTC